MEGEFDFLKHFFEYFLGADLNFYNKNFNFF